MNSLAFDTPALSLREAFAMLAERLDGRLVLPGDADWDAARSAWNLAVDQRPAAVVIAASAADVARTVRAARELGLGVAPQGTGHNAAPLAEGDGLADAILLKTHELRAVEVRPNQRIARVEAGALWGDVVAATAPHGLAALAGSSHDVGVVGYTLGGGVSFLGRAHGLAANHVVAVELVTADGEFRRVDAEHDAELFWAVRGGGGDFGVVTAIEFRLFEIAQVVAGTLFFPIERTREVLETWAEWTRSVPDTVTSVGRVLRFPPIPDLPPFLSGRSFVVVEAVSLESPERTDELLAPLRALHPEIDTVHPQAPADLLQLHMDPPGPTPGHGDGMMLADLPAEAVRAFVDGVGPDADTALLSAEIRHLGGAFEPAAAIEIAAEAGLPAPGAIAGFEGRYAVYAVGIAAPQTIEAVIASLGRLFARIEPWRAPVAYLNFTERPETGERFFGDDGRLARLRALKSAIDPAGVIRSNHPVRR
ncbi:FAD-binding oxidoreductase [Agromyces aurantiacus]|uniref:FAD-binding oxidoreductase n=1 Tax=Agromyces aurantiacus TaxID=165814 RepID=A0ABV9R173_9MICO|nr:FAD-binding oxidoreductase [Agromyces aurantiacus]MBM7506006.1 FAD/FMN-containing dehydrogenase [Agromyces aurantiacus]